MIPAEAVVVAAKAIFAEEQCDRRQKVDVEANWLGRLDDRDRAEYRRLARAALEAAAPYMTRIIATAAERATLRPGTICMDRAGNAWKRGTGSWVSTGGDSGPLYDEDDIELTVLLEPRPTA